MMSAKGDPISHPGVVDRIDNQTIYVKILSQSACASCYAKGACNMAEMQEKIVEIPLIGKQIHKVGDEVNVVMERTMGKKAVLLGYFFPFLIVITALIILTSVLESEGLAGLISIALVAPYYLILYLQRDRLRNTFEFKISPSG